MRAATPRRGRARIVLASVALRARRSWRHVANCDYPRTTRSLLERRSAKNTSPYRVWDGRSPSAGRRGYAPLVEPLSPELALIDPELAERACAQLTDPREPVPRPAPVRQPQQLPRPLPPPPMRPRAASAGRLRPAPRRRMNGGAILAVFALAAAAAIWARYDDGSSSPGGMAQLATQPQRDRSPQTATGERRETKTRASKQGVAGQRYARAAARSRRRATGGSHPRSAVRTHTLGSPRPAALHVPGVP